MLIDLAEVRWLAPPYNALAAALECPEACTTSWAHQSHTANVQACCTFLEQGGFELLQRLALLLTRMTPDGLSGQQRLRAAKASCLPFWCMNTLHEQAMTQSQLAARLGCPPVSASADLARLFFEHRKLPAVLDAVSATRHDPEHPSGMLRPLMLCSVHLSAAVSCSCETQPWAQYVVTQAEYDSANPSISFQKHR